MNRKHLQSLAKERVKDAKALLGRKRWAAAYYLAGYAVECGLKACVLRHIGQSDALFGQEGYLKKLEKCWTHNLLRLVELAGVWESLRAQCQRSSAFDACWTIVKDWSEVSRYELTVEKKARDLFEAITDKQHGVFQWIQKHW